MPTQKVGRKPYPWWNLPTIIEDMLTDIEHFELIQGESPKALPSTFENTKFPAIDDKLKQLLANWEEALAAHELARTRMVERKKNTFTPFEKGQKVWLDTRNLKTNYHKKMAPKWEGPFKIEEVLGPVTYCPPPGGFIMCFMLSYWNPTRKTRYTEKILPHHHWTS